MAHRLEGDEQVTFGLYLGSRDKLPEQKRRNELSKNREESRAGAGREETPAFDAAAIVREECQAFRRVLEILYDGVILIDHRHIVVYANQAARELFGFERGELLGSPLAALVPSGQREDHGRAVTEFASREGAG
ncbi:MAG TPA: PAS domain-containing protein [Pelomicrobium sp.]|nr:PAS domain-containing protein [Pelomicrobium sp.]